MHYHIKNICCVKCQEYDTCHFKKMCQMRSGRVHFCNNCIKCLNYLNFLCWVCTKLIQYLEIYFEKTNREKSVGIFGRAFFYFGYTAPAWWKTQPQLNFDLMFFGFINTQVEYITHREKVLKQFAARQTM